MRKILLAAASLAALSLPTLAADMSAPAGYDWSGPYAGISAGYAFGKSDVENTTLGTLGEVDPDGFMVGLYMGVNHQLDNNFVLGLDADVNFSLLEGEDSTIAGGLPSNVYNGESDWNGALRVRAGMAVDRALLYVAGGVALADYDITMVHTAGTNNDTDVLVGWTIGAGVEYAVSDNWTTRIEARYTDYGSMDDTFDGFPAEQVTADLSTFDVRLGMAYKF